MITLTGQHDKPEESSVYSTVKMGSAAGTVGYKNKQIFCLRSLKQTLYIITGLRGSNHPSDIRKTVWHFTGKLIISLLSFLGKLSPGLTGETVYSEIKLGADLGKHAAI